MHTQSAMHDFDSQSGIVFYSQVAVNGVSCWNSAKPYTPQNHALLERNDVTMIYPCDLNVTKSNIPTFCEFSLLQLFFFAFDQNF